MRRRQFIRGSMAAVVYVACSNSTENPESRGASSSGGLPPPDGGVGGHGGAEGGGGSTIPEDAGDGGGITPTSLPEDSDHFFPQGIVSGDPRPDRVLLWTRVDPEAAGRSPREALEVALIVATDEALTDIVARATVTAAPGDDHTVRVVPTGLEAGRFYHYRFECNGVTTRVGRTKTAPLPDADVTVRFAFCSCQDYIGRYWHSWQALLDDQADVDFVMFLGDYIYESVEDSSFQSSSPDRAIVLPHGFDTSSRQDGSEMVANTLEDYRALYKAYRSDPLLREVHRLYPFVVTWDDHEYSNDCWQDHSTYFNETDPVTGGFNDEKNPLRRQSANRAFHEYQPVDVSYAAGEPFPNDISIYRSLRFGKHVEVFMTDQRSYRSDHVVPEGPPDFSVGKIQGGSMVGSRYFVRKSGFDAREAAVKPTMLGDAQKAWLIDSIKNSPATWKVWGNEVQMWQMVLEMGDLPGVPSFFDYAVYMNCDQWDGYRSERAEILGTLSDAGVQNLLVCTGDVHAFFAAELHTNFDAPAAVPVAVEYVTAGIASASLGSEVMMQVGGATSPLAFVAEALVGPEPIQASNPHLRHADASGYGFAIADVDARRAEVTFVKLGDSREKVSSGVLGRHKMRTVAGSNRIEVV